ncbi:hypothetical protein MIND_00920400 [Mycena indigotica]|uniref:DUF5648 domain-containing protein n=1 Tax=Mycena indigotica TaxID=2126181 RepID=A0A8H6SC85_9AGAR|nr:uncharacterized protein MIND_00920400 [Mycena indigotica]KAF7296886.1 hypothetical protein MIND_00920400 [Mycena indigotica]
MKTSAFFALVVAAVGTLAASVALEEARDAPVEKRANCGSTITPIYRAYSASVQDHFYTTKASDATGASGYTTEGVAAAVFGTQQGDTLPLYRMYSSAAKDHFYTTDPVERDYFRTNNGYVLEGNAAFVYTTQICDSIPLYRLYAANVKDHLYTTSRYERDSALALGFLDQGIAAYVPGPGVINADIPWSTCNAH